MTKQMTETLILSADSASGGSLSRATVARLVPCDTVWRQGSEHIAPASTFGQFDSLPIVSAG